MALAAWWLDAGAVKALLRLYAWTSSVRAHAMVAYKGSYDRWGNIRAHAMVAYNGSYDRWGSVL